MTEGKLDDWRYEVKKTDPESSKAALRALIEEEDKLTELDLEDEYTSDPVKLVIFADQQCKVIEDDDDATIKIDFKEKVLHLSQRMSEASSVSRDIPAQRIRYTGLTWSNPDSSRNDGRLVLLSTWNADDRSIQNLYLQASDPSSAMMLVSAITRLVYEASDKSKIRTHRFCVITEVPVDVAFSTADERDARDEIKLKLKEKATAEGDATAADTDVEQLSELRKSQMYLVTDEEAICLFENQFSADPLHDFRFYREPTGKSIDTIYVCNDELQLELQSGDRVFYIEPRSRDADAESKVKELVELFRRATIKPKPQNVFTGSGKEFESFYSDGSIGKPYKLPKASFEPPAPAAAPFPHFNPRSGPSGAGRGAPGSSNVWIEFLSTGDHLSQAAEEMQMQWFEVESQLESVIGSGEIPESDFDSSGLDERSETHLLNVVESIKDKLFTGKYGEAVSQVNGCMKVFGGTLLNSIQHEKPIEILKKIYFLTG